MHPQLVQDQEQLLRGALDQPAQEVDQDVGVERALEEAPAPLALVVLAPTVDAEPSKSAGGSIVRALNWVTQSAETAAVDPQGTSNQPAARCQAGRRRRKLGENWKAPSTQSITALTKYSTTGSGPATNRALSAVIAMPPPS